MFGHLGDLGPRDLSAPRRTGRRRAEQEAPIAAVLSSFRIGFAFIWDCVVTEARQSETLSDAELGADSVGCVGAPRGIHHGDDDGVPRRAD